MFNMSSQELLIILVIALIVVGPQRLPELSRSIGKGLRELRKVQDDMKDMVKFDLEPERTTPARRPASPTAPGVHRTPKPAAATPPAPGSEPGAASTGRTASPGSSDDAGAPTPPPDEASAGG